MWTVLCQHCCAAAIMLASCAVSHVDRALPALLCGGYHACVSRSGRTQPMTARPRLLGTGTPAGPGFQADGGLPEFHQAGQYLPGTRRASHPVDLVCWACSIPAAAEHRLIVSALASMQCALGSRAGTHSQWQPTGRQRGGRSCKLWQAATKRSREAASGRGGIPL